MITLTAEYAIRAVVFLGGRAGRTATTRRIAAGTQVPAAYLSKVLQALRRAGIVETGRGLLGGQTLARPPAELTILDVIEAVQPRRRAVSCRTCLSAGGGPSCAVHRRLAKGTELAESLFRQTTLDQLVSADEAG